jgi:hypothetical protein
MDTMENMSAMAMIAEVEEKIGRYFGRLFLDSASSA